MKVGVYGMSDEAEGRCEAGGVELRPVVVRNCFVGGGDGGDLGWGSRSD